MLNKEVVEKKYRNLFLKSEFLKKSSKLKNIYNLLASDENSDQMSAETIQYINRNRSNWIIQCRSEWKRDPNQFKESIRKSPVKQHCQLCNAYLSANKYHVINKENGRALSIGSECVEKMLNNSEQIYGNHIDTPEEYIRREELYEANPELQKVIDNNSYKSEAEFVLDINIEKRISSFIRSTRTLINKYVQDQTSLKKPIIDQIMLKAKKIRSDIEHYNRQASLDQNNYLTTIEASEIIESRNKFILKEVQNNDGKLNQDIAAQITTPTFIKRILGLNKKRSPFASFTINGAIDVHFMINQKLYNIRYKSSDFISVVGFNPNFSENKLSNQQLLDGLSKSKPMLFLDSETKTNLIENVLNIFDDFSVFTPRLKSFQKFVAQQEIKMKQKTKITSRKFQNAFSGTIFLINNSKKYISLNLNDLQIFGLSTLYSHNNRSEIRQTIINNSKHYDTYQKLFMEIYNTIVLNEPSRF